MNPLGLGGRPEKSPADRKSYFLTFRVTREEYNRAHELARKTGKKISGWLRELLQEKIK